MSTHVGVLFLQAWRCKQNHLLRDVHKFRGILYIQLQNSPHWPIHHRIQFAQQRGNPADHTAPKTRRQSAKHLLVRTGLQLTRSFLLRTTAIYIPNPSTNMFSTHIDGSFNCGILSAMSKEDGKWRPVTVLQFLHLPCPTPWESGE